MWDASECGNFQKDYLDLVVIPTIEHIPWVKHNILEGENPGGGI